LHHDRGVAAQTPIKPGTDFDQSRQHGQPQASATVLFSQPHAASTCRLFQLALLPTPCYIPDLDAPRAREHHAEVTSEKE